MKRTCPEIPYFGADYPDARCVNGYLWNIECYDENGNLYQQENDQPCPFCNTEEFIKADPYHIRQDPDTEMDEEKVRQWYLDLIEGMRSKYEK